MVLLALALLARPETGPAPVVQGEAEQIELGADLFFDPILSLDSTISCGSCHQPKFAFADSVAFSKGVGDSLGERNTPSVMNMAFRPYFFYDGRAATLEEQAQGPIENPVEMHLDYNLAVRRIIGESRYQKQFKEAYGSAPDSALVLAALATFVRSLESDGSAPQDRWLSGGDIRAINNAQFRGRTVFLDKGKCFDCHLGPDFTNDEFRNVGLYEGNSGDDLGRFKITGDSTDLGKLKVPGLRNVALTAPYMHDGRFKTLEEVIDYYDDPSQFVSNSINRDTSLNKPLRLTAQEKDDLLQFLHSLTDAKIPYLDR